MIYMKIEFLRTDLADDNNLNKYRTVKFNILNNDVKDEIKDNLRFFINMLESKNSVLVIGLGNDNFTADSVGPKCLKFINVNAFLGNDIDCDIRVSAIEPGVLGQTGIDTTRIIKSIVKEIKPSFLIVIDSFICDNVEKLEKNVQISNVGITPGSGVMGLNSNINESSLGVPVIVIGVPTALEATINNQKLILSSHRVDKYVLEIAKIIGEAINEVLYFG